MIHVDFDCPNENSNTWYMNCSKELKAFYEKYKDCKKIVNYYPINDVLLRDNSLCPVEEVIEIIENNKDLVKEKLFINTYYWLTNFPLKLIMEYLGYKNINKFIKENIIKDFTKFTYNFCKECSCEIYELPSTRGELDKVKKIIKKDSKKSTFKRLWIVRKM